MTWQATTMCGNGLPPSVALNRFNPPRGTSLGKQSEAVPQRQRFGVSIGQTRLLIHPDLRSEVTTQMSIYSMPNVPSWFLGVMNLRGNLLPVFDLHQLLQTGQTNRSNRVILILHQRRDGVGVIIDGLPQSVILGDAMHNLPPLPSLLQEHVTAAYTTDGLLWLEFDHQSFFTALGERITG